MSPAFYNFLYSPGNLSDGLIEEQVKSGVSFPRNELLFSNAIYLLPYTGAGSGVQRALSLYPSMILKNDELRNKFIITIPRRTTETALGLDSVNNVDSKDVSGSVKDVSVDINHVSSIIGKPSVKCIFYHASWDLFVIIRT